MLVGMRMSRAIGFLALSLCVAPAGAQGPSFIDAYREPVARVIAAATADQFAWNRLALLTDTFGHRLSGSQALEDAIAWSVDDDEGRWLRPGLDRPGEGAEVGPRRRVARPDCSAHAPHTDARSRHERRHAARRHRGRRCSSSAASPNSSAAARRRADASCCSTRPIAATGRRSPTAPTAPRRRLSTARSRCSCARWDLTACGRRTPACSPIAPACRRSPPPRSRPKTHSASRAWRLAASGCACA